MFGILQLSSELISLSLLANSTITLNADRHRGNFVIEEEEEAGTFAHKHVFHIENKSHVLGACSDNYEGIMTCFR